MWKNVTKEHVIQAIELHERLTEHHSPSKNAFLIVEGKQYPAKHIRALAYKIANGKEISKINFNGGKETADFFRELGLNIKYI